MAIQLSNVSIEEKEEILNIIQSEKEKYAEERVREFAMGLIDQLQNHTIVDQYDDETDSTAPIEETKLVSDVLRKTAVEVIEMFLEDFREKK